jgi:hypothetical protein
VVLFRKEDGTPVALEDRCVHRHLPLSMGRLVGDTLQCHYHGLRYDGTGACVLARISRLRGPGVHGRGNGGFAQGERALIDMPGDGVVHPLFSLGGCGSRLWALPFMWIFLSGCLPT